MRKSAHLKNSKSDVHLEMGDAKERSPFCMHLGKEATCDACRRETGSVTKYRG